MFLACSHVPMKGSFCHLRSSPIKCTNPYSIGDGCYFFSNDDLIFSICSCSKLEAPLEGGDGKAKSWVQQSVVVNEAKATSQGCTLNTKEQSILNNKTESIMKLPHFRKAFNEDAKMDDVRCLNSRLTALCCITLHVKKPKRKRQPKCRRKSRY